MKTTPTDSGTNNTILSRDDAVADKSRELLAKLPVILKDVNDKIAEIGPRIPLNVFLYQEVLLLQDILVLVRKSLTELQNAVRGETILTPGIEDDLSDSLVK